MFGLPLTSAAAFSLALRATLVSASRGPTFGAR